MRLLIEKKSCINVKAFTLIEVLVSVSIFSMVMLISTGAVFSIVEANKKTHSLKSVMTNLNFALESMMREIRVGRSYSCNGGGDCEVLGGTRFRFKSNRDINGSGGYDASDQMEYAFDAVNGSITRQILGGGPNGNVTPVRITASEIVIESMKFYVLGTGTTDQKQPKVVITVQGYSGTGSTRSDFNIQTTVTQRPIDS